MLRKIPGTYMLFLKAAGRAEAGIGRMGVFIFEPGLYAYVGSARGPGGLYSRLRRYACGPGRRRWHIDFFLPCAEINGAVLKEGLEHLECAWAAWAGEKAVSSMKGFGSSDCRCRSHLFYLGEGTDPDRFGEKAEKALEACFYPKKSLFNAFE